MAVSKTPAKILRVLGNPDPVLERTHVGIYDALDQLTTLAYQQSVIVETPITDVAAYTTIETVGFPFTKRRILNFAGPFLITDDLANARTTVDIGLFSSTIKGAVSASGGGSTNFLRADGVWAPPSGGITQLTGDVTAGPGTGSQVATLARIPSGTPALGSILFSTIAAPGTPAAGKVIAWADTTSKKITSKDQFGNISTNVVIGSATPSNWVTNVSTLGVLVTSQPAFSDISGVLAGSQFGPLTGDVTTSGYVATLANIPSDTPMAGDLLATAMGAPGAPPAGKGRIYVDSTSLNLAHKNASGVVNHGIQTRTATASNWIRSIADDGSTTISQPNFTDLAGTATLSQLGSGGALSVLGVAGNAGATRADIASSAGSGFALRESGSTIGFGQLATGAYTNNSVTYAKIQTTAAGSVLLGRGNSGAGNVQELTVSGNLSINGTVLSASRAFSMTWGGGIAIGGFLTIPRAVRIGVGDNSFFDATSPVYPFMSFVAPDPSDTSTQDWSINIASSTLTGTGFFAVKFTVNGTVVVTLGTFAASVAAQSTTTTTFQTVNKGDILGIQIDVSSGTITGGSLVIYVVGSFR